MLTNSNNVILWINHGRTNEMPGMCASRSIMPEPPGATERVTGRPGPSAKCADAAKAMVSKPLTADSKNVLRAAI